MQTNKISVPRETFHEILDAVRIAEIDYEMVGPLNSLNQDRALIFGNVEVQITEFPSLREHNVCHSCLRSVDHPIPQLLHDLAMARESAKTWKARSRQAAEQLVAVRNIPRPYLDWVCPHCAALSSGRSKVRQTLDRFTRWLLRR